MGDIPQDPKHIHMVHGRNRRVFESLLINRRNLSESPDPVRTVEEARLAVGDTAPSLKLNQTLLTLGAV